MKSNNSNVTLTSEQLRQAADLQDTITASQNELTALLCGKSVAKTVRKAGAPAGKRTMSAEQREKIAAGQRARWAKQNAEKGASAPIPAPVS